SATTYLELTGFGGENAGNGPYEKHRLGLGSLGDCSTTPASRSRSWRGSVSRVGRCVLDHRRDHRSVRRYTDHPSYPVRRPDRFRLRTLAEAQRLSPRVFL